MRRKKFLNRVLASALTATMLVSSVPVTTLAAESGSSEAELFSEGTDSGAAESLSSEAEDFSDEAITSETAENSDAAQTDDAAETPEISETEDIITQEPSDEEPVQDASEDTSDVEDDFTDDIDNAGLEDDELQMDADQDNTDEVSEIEEQSDSSDEADSLELDAGDADVAGANYGSTSEFEYTYYGTNATITKYIGSSTVVSIPSSIGGYTVTAIGSMSFRISKITYVSIPNTVTEIGSYAFAGCESLTSLTLPESIINLGPGFISNTAISNIIIPKNVTGGGTEFAGALDGAKSLKSVTFEYGIKRIPDYMCYATESSSISSVSMPDTVTEIGKSAFRNCKSLANIRLSSGLININGSAFSGSGLISVDIPKTIADIGNYAFEDCKSLQSVIMNYNDTIVADGIHESYVYKCYIQGAVFAGDVNLNYVQLSENVEGIGYHAFYRCSSLTSLTLPERITALGREFISGTAISSITVPKNVTSAGDEIGGAFAGAISLKNVKFEEGIKEIPKYICYVANYPNKISEVSIPDTVVNIGRSAFEGSGLISVDIPKTVSNIGYSAFKDCTLLQTVTMNYNDTIIESTTEGAYVYKCRIDDSAFEGDTSLSFVRLSENVVEIGSYVFNKCSSLAELVLPERVTSLGRQFIGETAINSITVPKNVISAGDRDGGAFQGATLKNITFEEGIKKIPDYICFSGNFFSYINNVSIPDTVTRIGEAAFQNCKSLREIQLSSQLTDIDNYVFKGSGLISIDIPKTVSYIGYSGFRDCVSLQTVTMNYNDTVIESTTEGTYVYKCTINDSAFEGDTSLSLVRLSENIVKIGSYAFNKCTSLTGLILPERVTQLGRRIIGETAISSIMVPKNVISAGDRDGGAFSGTVSLKSISFEEGMEKIPSYVCYAGGNVSYIASVNIPDTVNEIGSYAFKDCIALKTLEVSDNIKEIDYAAFYGCKGLTTIKIGSKDRKDESAISELTVKQATNKSSELKLDWKLAEGNYITIYNSAFEKCTGLKTVRLSVNVKSIGSYGFYDCSSLSNVYFLGTEEEWEQISIGDSGNEPLTSASRHFSKYSEEKETGYEVACALKRNGVYSSKNTEFVAVPESTLTMNYTPKKAAKTYYVRIRKCTKYKDSGEVRYGNWSSVVCVSLTGFVTEEEIQTAVKEFVKSMENYEKQLQFASKADLKNYKDTKTQAQILRETDENSRNKILTFVGTQSDRIKDCAYEALAEYIQSSVKFDLGNLDIKSTKSTQKYAKQIVDAVYNNVQANTTSKTIRTDAGTMRLNLTGFSGAFTGDVSLNNKTIAVVVSTDANKVMVDYLKNLSNAVNNLLYQSCTSLFKEFADATGLKELWEEEKMARMQTLEADLKKAGYGKMYKTMAAMKEAYELVEAIHTCTDSDNLKELLKNSKSCYDKLSKLSFSDSSLTKIVLKDAEAEMEGRRQDLGKLLYAYYTGTKAGQMNSWFGKVWTKIMGNCPVNMVVYDVLGNEIGRVVNGRASYKPEAVFTVEGNTKTAYVESSTLGRIQFTGTGSGTMNYSIQEMNGDEVVNQLNYYDVPLEEGTTYTQEFTGETLDTDGSHSNLITKDSEEIKESNTNNSDIEPEYVTVSCTAETGGTVSEGGQVIRGQRTSVEAIADEGYTFGGWYNGEELVSTDSTYYFAPSKDVSLTAKFEKQIPVDNNYRAVAAEDSQANMFIVMNKNGSGNLNITGAGTESKASFILKCYPTANGTPEQQTITVNNNGSGIYVYENLAYSKYEKLELCDTAGKLLVTLWKKDLLLKNIADVEITLSGDKFKHTGKEIRPEVTVKDLDKDLDYTVEYKDNINAGTASVIITGIGDYKGTVTKTFIIYNNEAEVCEHKNKVTSKAAKPATCTEDGYTAEIKCADCGTILEESTVVKATGHKEVTSKAAKAATCTENGYTVETKCSVCGKILTESTEIKATGHKEVTDAAVAATALKTGKTAGSHCSVCGTVIKKQATIPKLPATIKLSTTKKTVKETQYFTLTVSKLAKGDSIKSIKPSGKSILKVQKIRTNKYKITGIKAGTAKVTVILKSNKKAICTVKVEKRTLTVNKSKVTLSRGKSTTLTVKGSPAVSTKAKTVKFSSSNSKIATVTSTGKITAKKAGTCKIYVKGNGITKVVTVTVKK